MSLATMQSILRDLFSKIPSYPASSGEPEEHVARPKQYPVAKTWNVETVETFALEENRRTEPEHVWKTKLPCVDPHSWVPFSVQLTHFLDGTQRTSSIREIPWQKQGFSTVPFFVAQTTCIVLRRQDRRLSVNKELSYFQILLEVPIRFLARNAHKEVAKAFNELKAYSSFRDFLWVDTSYRTQVDTENDPEGIHLEHLEGKYAPIPDGQFKEALADPNWLSSQSRKWTMKYRDALEQAVFNKLADQLDKPTADGKHFRLAVRDGTLTAVRGKFAQTAIGLSKSFNTRFLEPHLQTRVLALPKWHRTPVFKFSRDARGTEPDEAEFEDGPALKSPQKHTRLSWYVRIRQHDPTMPFRGILRVEIHPNLLPSAGSADRWQEDDSRIVSAISGAIVEEANPTSHPDPRWHNLVYPICMCERYARARMIPHDTIRYMHWGKCKVPDA
jgi:hypothetical protein